MKTVVQKTILGLTLVLFATGVSFAQKNLINRANEEFDKFAYIDAREIYLSAQARCGHFSVTISDL